MIMLATVSFFVGLVLMGYCIYLLGKIDGYDMALQDLKENV